MKSRAKNSQLQIRVSEPQKRAIRNAAKRAGLHMSEHVLSRVLSIPTQRFQQILEELSVTPSPSFALAALHDLLSALSASELREAIASHPEAPLSAYLSNYVAAMIETVCAARTAPVPAWARSVAPLSEPIFGSELKSLRLHLLTQSPPAFRRRNLFVDGTIGSRV